MSANFSTIIIKISISSLRNCIEKEITLQRICVRLEVQQLIVKNSLNNLFQAYNRYNN